MKNQVPYYFKMAIAVGYIILGLMALTTGAGEALVGNKTIAIVFGLACIVYGAFRIYRNQKRWDEMK